MYAQEKRLTEFYTKHHDFWTTLIKSVEEFSENLHELNKNNEVSADFDRLKQILSSPAPYDMIPEAYELFEKVRAFNETIVKEKTDQCCLYPSGKPANVYALALTRTRSAS